jgi:hypothetical protein
MANLSYEAYLQGKIKTAKKKSDLSYSAYLKNKEEQENIAQQKAELVKQGLPVSTRKDRVAPSFAGNIIRGAIKPLADVATQAVNLGQIALNKKETKPFSGSYLGNVEGLGKVDLTKSPWDEENLKTIIKSAATGAEIASYLSATGVGAKTIQGLTQRGVLANKKTFAEWVVKTIPGLAKEGLIQGTSYTLGSQGREYADTGKPFSAKQAVQDVTLGTLGNVAIPMALQKGLGTSTSKILGARAAERAAKEAEILGKKVPDVGTKFDNIKPKTNILEDTFNPQETPRSTKPVMSFDTTIPPKDTITPTVAKEIPVTETPATVKEIPAEIITKDADNMVNDVPGDFDYGTFQEWSQGVRGLDMDEVINVAMGGEKTVPNTIPKNAYLSIAKNIANETGDVKLAQRLAMSNVASKGGQELVASKLTSTDNIVDALRDIRTSFMKKKGIKPEKLTQEESSLINNVKKTFKEIDDAIINSLICK